MREIKFRVWTGDEMLFPGAPKYLAIGATSWGFWEGDYLLASDTNENHMLMQYTGLKDCNDVEIYDNDIVRYKWGVTLSYGVIKWNMDSYSCNKGWFISCWCGTPPYGYDCENISWDKLEVVGNTCEDADFLETIKYGVTNGDKPRTRDGIKSIIMTSLKKERRSFNGWIPSQVNINNCGVMDSALGNGLRDELVGEGKLLQDPNRPWMVKIND